LSKAITIHGRSFEVYIPAEHIANETKRIASQIKHDHPDQAPVFIGVLNGAFMFFSDLLKHYDAPCEVSFIKAKSYQGMQSTGHVEFESFGNLDIKDRHVIVVEDIVDTGNTLRALYDHLEQLRPKQLQVCSLLFKKEAYKQSLPIDYVCFETDNKFLLGYGLDFDGYGRNLPEVYILKD
jgi:hypoxanthine phosphoribosyltransferase